MDNALSFSLLYNRWNNYQRTNSIPQNVKKNLQIAENFYYISKNNFDFHQTSFKIPLKLYRFKMSSDFNITTNTIHRKSFDISWLPSRHILIWIKWTKFILSFNIDFDLYPNLFSVNNGANHTGFITCIFYRSVYRPWTHTFKRNYCQTMPNA